MSAAGLEVITLIKNSSQKRQTKVLFQDMSGLARNSPFFDVVFTSSSVIDGALHELGLCCDEYSLIGVVE